MRRFSAWLHARWYAPRFSPALLLFLPLSALFAMLVFLRRLCYRLGLLRTTSLPVPVIVVGNITVGGAGKTPLVLALASALRDAGWHPGIVSRGYGGRHAQKGSAPRPVLPDADPLETGDEPLLLARKSALPVWIGRDRALTGAALLAAHPETDLLLCDDGLQHYRLQRDVEIAVFDARGFGNGWLLPAGPLREPLSRLLHVDFLITHGSPKLPKVARKVPHFGMRLEAGECYRLAEPSTQRPLSDFRGQTFHAVAGIGHPGRFFATLDEAALTYLPHPFPDHHPYTEQDLAFSDGAFILMTEKDSVKCLRFNLPPAWVVPVTAQIPAAFVAHVLARIEATKKRPEKTS